MGRPLNVTTPPSLPLRGEAPEQANMGFPPHSVRLQAPSRFSSPPQPLCCACCPLRHFYAGQTTTGWPSPAHSLIPLVITSAWARAEPLVLKTITQYTILLLQLAHMWLPGGAVFFLQAPIVFPAIPYLLAQMVQAQVGFPALARALAILSGAWFQPSGAAIQPDTGHR